jgi:hypothetical protein
MKTYVSTFVILNEQKGNKQLIASKEKSNQMMSMCH